MLAALVALPTKSATRRLRLSAAVLLAASLACLLPTTPPLEALLAASALAALAYLAAVQALRCCCRAADPTANDARWAAVRAGASRAALAAALANTVEPPAPLSRDTAGRTLLHQAVLTAPHLIEDLLLRARVPPAAADASGATCLHLAASQPAIAALAAHAPAFFATTGPLALHARLASGSCEAARLLCAAGVPLDALSLASAMPHLPCMRLVLAGGWAPAPAHLAQALQHPAALHLLLAKGARPAPGLLRDAVARSLLEAASALLPHVPGSARAAAIEALDGAKLALERAAALGPLKWALAQPCVTPALTQSYVTYYRHRQSDARKAVDAETEAVRDSNAEALLAARAAADAGRDSAEKQRSAERVQSDADALLRQARSQRALAESSRAAARAAAAAPPPDAPPTALAAARIAAAQHNSAAAQYVRAAVDFEAEAAPFERRARTLRREAEDALAAAAAQRESAEARRSEASRSADKARRAVELHGEALLLVQRHTGGVAGGGRGDDSSGGGSGGGGDSGAGRPAVTTTTTTTTTVIGAPSGSSSSGSKPRMRAGSRMR